MIDVFYLVAGSSSQSDGAFDQRWRALGRPSIPDLQRFVLVHPYRQEDADADSAEKAAEWVFGGAFPYGGVVEISVEDIDAWHRIQGQIDEYLRVGLGDTVDLGASAWIATRPHSVIGGPSDTENQNMLKALFFPRRKDGVSAEEFSRHWREEHAALVPDTPHLVRYLQGHSVECQVPSGSVPYAGVAQLWWRTIDELEEATRSATFLKDQPADAAQFVDAESLFGFIGVEYSPDSEVVSAS
jgi:uncharacterized protein (TIGR02118 family)